MKYTATHINYYHICHRKLWLYENGIQMEHTSDLVYDGNLIHENSYAQRPDKWREIQIGRIKIDHYDPKNKVIHEVKRSNKMEAAHIAQLQYYIYALELIGITGVTGLLEYPKLKQTKKVELTNESRAAIQQWLLDIDAITALDEAPNLIHKPFCKSCSYYELCYADEI